MILDTLVVKVSNIEQGQIRLENEMAELKTDVAGIKIELKELQVKVDDLQARFDVMQVKVDEIDTNLKAVSALQNDDYNLLKTIEKKVGSLSSVTSLHEQRFMKLKEVV